jgi:hypothetical protein
MIVTAIRPKPAVPATFTPRSRTGPIEKDCHAE